MVVTALDTLDRGSFISVCEDAPLHSAPGHDPVANGIGGEVWNGREGFATSVLGCGEKALRAVVMVFGEMLHLSVYRTISITLAQNSSRIFNLNAQVCYFSLSMIYGTKNTGAAWWCIQKHNDVPGWSHEHRILSSAGGRIIIIKSRAGVISWITANVAFKGLHQRI